MHAHSHHGTATRTFAIVTLANLAYTAVGRLDGDGADRIPDVLVVPGDVKDEEVPEVALDPVAPAPRGRRQGRERLASHRPYFSIRR